MNVGEARALLDHANTLLAEGMTAAQSAAGKFAEAETALTTLQGGTSAALGTGATRSARKQCEGAFVQGHAAIETNSIFGASL